MTKFQAIAEIEKNIFVKRCHRDDERKIITISYFYKDGQKQDIVIDKTFLHKHYQPEFDSIEFNDSTAIYYAALHQYETSRPEYKIKAALRRIDEALLTYRLLCRAFVRI